MRAAQIDGRDGRLALVDVAESEAGLGASLITVIAGGGGSSDLQRANGVFGAITGSYVVGGEGVGRLVSGERVFFGRSTNPFGACAERTLVTEEEVWPLPDPVEDGLAIALGISGIGALIALEEARIQPGECVLVLGATRPVGQIAPQLARLMGAGPVVAAGRDMRSLDGSGNGAWRTRSCNSAQAMILRPSRPRQDKATTWSWTSFTGRRRRRRCAPPGLERG